MPVGSYSYRNVDYERDLKKDQEPISVYQDIDPAILRLLGLTDVFDLDYSTYKTLLKEAMVKGRMPKTEIPNEEVELLTNEWRKVKSSTGRFKIKKKTVKVSPLLSKQKSIAGKKVDPVKMLPGSVKDPVEESREDKKERKERESEESIFNSIFNSLNNIYTTLKSAFKSDKKNAADAADEKELKRRQGKESFMEGFKRFVANTAKKTLQPAVNILKKILDGIKLVLVGWVLNNLIDWLGDEKNRENVDAVTQFLSRNFLKLIVLWTALSAAGGIGVLVKLGATILAGVVKLMWSMGSALVRAGIRNPLTALAIGGTVAIGVGAMNAGQRQQKDREETNKKFDDQVVTPKEFKETGETPGYLQLLGEQGSFPGGLQFNEGGPVIDPEIAWALQMGLGGGGGGTNSLTEQAKVKTWGSAIGDFFSGDDGRSRKMTDLERSQRMATGGFVSGPGGVDKVPAKLTAGEFVMSKGAVDKWGVGTLAGMNAAGGGNNTGSLSRGFSEGGMVPFPEGSFKGGPRQVFGASRDGGTRMHVGIDVTEDHPWNSDPARPIYAPVKSRVLSEEFQRAGYTRGLMLDHGDGFQSRYVHMNTMKNPGDVVEAGEQIGKLLPLGKGGGNTHLHFELYNGSKVLNPTGFYKALTSGTYKPSAASISKDVGSVPSPELAKLGSTSTPGSASADSLISSVPPGLLSQAMLMITGATMDGPTPDDINQQASSNDVQIPKPIDSSNISIVATKSMYQLIGA